VDKSYAPADAETDVTAVTHSCPGVH